MADVPAHYMRLDDHSAIVEPMYSRIRAAGACISFLPFRDPYQRIIGHKGHIDIPDSVPAR